MDGKVLSTRPCVLHDDIRCDVPDLPDDIQLAQPIEAGALVRHCLKLVPVIVINLANGMQPVVDKAAAQAVHRGAYPATSVIPTTMMCFTFRTSTANWSTER
jgi:hypothetical protein